MDLHKDNQQLILTTQYMPSISWMALFLYSDTLIDAYEHYQKNSLRNRATIATPNGALKLSVPLLHGRNQRRPVKNVQVYNDENWLALHWKSLQNNYRKSPFFEFFEAEMEVFFEKKYQSLIEANHASVAMILELLNTTKELHYTHHFYPKSNSDAMQKISKGTPEIIIPEYQQVFMDRTGFLANMSTLDLLFCLGPQSSLEYLENLHPELMKLF